MADAGDSKSPDRKVMRVQVPPVAPRKPPASSAGGFLDVQRFFVWNAAQFPTIAKETAVSASENPALSKSVQPPQPRSSPPSWMITVAGMLFMVVLGALAITVAHQPEGLTPKDIGELGMIRTPSRWTDHDRVTYRTWEADMVIVAVPPAPASEDGLEYGDRCFVQGSTVVRLDAFHAGDAVLEVVRLADRQAEPEEGDCPFGTMFIASEEEMLRMMLNWHIYAAQRDRDFILLNGRLPFRAMLD